MSSAPRYTCIGSDGIQVAFQTMPTYRCCVCLGTFAVLEGRFMTLRCRNCERFVFLRQTRVNERRLSYVAVADDTAGVNDNSGHADNIGNNGSDHLCVSVGKVAMESVKSDGLAPEVNQIDCSCPSRIPSVMHVRVKGGPIGLRMRPTLDSPYVHRSEKQVDIIALQRIIALSTRLEDGYLCVSVGDDAGYVHMEHIHWSNEHGTRFTQLTDADWWNTRWTIESSACFIRVSHADRGDELAVDLAEIGVGQTKKAIDILSNGYTYVSLEVGWPFSTERNTQVSGKCHLTIAYCERMRDREVEQLRTMLEEDLRTYFTMAPEQRPHDLIHFRKYRVITDKEYDLYDSFPLIALRTDEIAYLVEEGMIESSSCKHGEPLAHEVQRINERDLSRMHMALERAQHVQKHTGELVMRTPASGLGGSTELFDLLEYLADTVLHSPPCQFVKPNGKTRPPFVTSLDRWHCSRPGDWQQSPIMYSGSSQS